MRLASRLQEEEKITAYEKNNPSLSPQLKKKKTKQKKKKTELRDASASHAL